MRTIYVVMGTPAERGKYFMQGEYSGVAKIPRNNLDLKTEDVI